MGRDRCLTLSFAWAALRVLIGCGGSSAPPPPPPPPAFSISVSPSSVSIGVGGTTSPVTISVNAKNGFTGSVDIQLQGIPQEVTPSPSSSFSLAPGAIQAVTFNVHPSQVLAGGLGTDSQSASPRPRSNQLDLKLFF